MDISGWKLLDMTVDGKAVRCGESIKLGGYDEMLCMSVGDEVYRLVAREWKGYGGGRGCSSAAGFDVYVYGHDTVFASAGDGDTNIGNMFEIALVKAYFANRSTHRS